MKIRHASFLASAAGLIVAACSGDAPVSAASTAATSTSSVPQSISAAEKAQGAKAHPELLQEFGGAYDSPQTGYVVAVGKKIAVQSGLGNAESDFTVTLLNSPVNNAFAIPGGYVYITRQLTALANDEAELAGVLGHEVGHVAARHSKKREKAAQRNAILGILGQVAGGFLGDTGVGGMLGGALKQYSGTVAQMFTLKFSRAQEEQADDLGIRYLHAAGYDEQALSRMLYSLALQNSVDAMAAGRDARSVPEWASTHPDPARRVTRASGVAAQYKGGGGVRNEARHLSAINGMLYGDDPKQGVIEGQNFLHPDLKLKFTAPNGYGMQNGAAAVTISGTGGQAQFSTGAYGGDINSYIDGVFNALAGEGKTMSHSAIQRTTVNGIPAAYASATANTSSGEVSVVVFAYEFGAGQAYHFVTVTKPGTNPFSAMFGSVTRLSSAEATAIKPRKVQVVTVRSGDSLAALANRMAYPNLQTERFLALNGMAKDAALKSGQKVKIVTY